MNFSENYLNLLKNRQGFFLNGNEINILESDSFRKLIEEMTRLYKLHNDSRYCNILTHKIKGSNIKISTSYLLPYNKKLLEKKWENTHFWMKETFGLIPRLPDFLQNVLIGLFDFKESISDNEICFKKNIEKYYDYCSKNNIVHTHAIADIQIDRSKNGLVDESLSLQVIKKTSEGIIVRGAKQLASFAPFSHEIMVYLNPGSIKNTLEKNVIWFALPIGVKGLKFVCREPYSNKDNSYSSHFRNLDEQDAVVFFDDVLVPYDRIFLLNDKKKALEGYYEINKWSIYSNLIRFYYRYDTFYKIASAAADSIGVNIYPNIKSKLGELILFIKVIERFLISINMNSFKTKSGLYSPGDTNAASIYVMENSMHAAQIVRDITVSGIIMQPTENDLKSSSIAPLIEKYMRGCNVKADYKAGVFRLASDLVASTYGMRQIIYDQWFRGPIGNHKIDLYSKYYNKKKQDDFLNRCLNLT